MMGVDVVLAGLALALTVLAGLVAHEWSHALVLRATRIEYTIAYFPDRTAGLGGLLASCPWAVVRPRPTGRESPWALRFAALAPLSLAVPVFALGLSGVVPADTPIGTAIALGWLACAIPSPQDFSVAFYAHRALEATSGPHAASSLSRAD